MLHQLKQFCSLAAVALAALSLSSTVQAECFNGSGRAGMIRNLERPWVFTVYIPDKAESEGHYRIKSFGVNLVGKMECKGSKTSCQTDRGPVSLRKTERGLEMKFSSDLAIEKRNESEDGLNDSKAQAAQKFSLDTAHSDVCYDAFFKASKYDDYAKAHGNQITFPLNKTTTPAAPLGQTASAEPIE